MSTQIKSAVAQIEISETLEVQLINEFEQFLKNTEVWREKTLDLIVTEESQTDKMKIAREARLALKAIRVQANKKRTELKADSIKYGKAVQAVYNVIEEQIKPLEEHLLRQETFVELKKKEEEDRLAKVRLDELEEFSEFVPINTDLGCMSEDDYQLLLNGAKLLKSQREEELKAAEEARVKEAEEAEIKRKKLEEENRRLREQARVIEEQQKAEAQRMAEEAEKKKAAEDAARIEAEKLKNGPDHVKLIHYLSALEEVETPEVDAEDAKAALLEVASLLKKHRLSFMKKVER